MGNLASAAVLSPKMGKEGKEKKRKRQPTEEGATESEQASKGGINPPPRGLAEALDKGREGKADDDAAAASSPFQGQSTGAGQEQPKPKKKKKKKQGDAGAAAEPLPASTDPAPPVHGLKTEQPAPTVPANLAANLKTEQPEPRKKKKKKVKEAELPPEGVAPPARVASEDSQHPAESSKPKKKKRKLKTEEQGEDGSLGVTKAEPGVETAEEGKAEADALARADAQPSGSGEQAASGVNPKKKKEKGAVADGEGDGPTKSEAAAAGAGGGGAKAMPGIGGGDSWAASYNRKDLKHGRFSEAEKAALKAAVAEYAAARGLPEDDHRWLFATSTGEQRERTSGAWKVIATNALPNRSIRSVWMAGTRILHPDNYKGGWKEEEDARLRELVQANGKKWKSIGEELGRMPLSCRDRYRDLVTLTEENRKGRWSPEECNALQEAVDQYMAIKQENEERSKTQAATLSLEDVPSPLQDKPPEREDARALLDDIDWVLVAQKVGTRNRVQCMDKWYNNLAPSMVTQGLWGSGDDRRLLKGLLRCGAREAYDVPWDDLVAGRSAAQSKRRWYLMLKRVVDCHEKSFAEQVEFLVDNFAPGLKKSAAPEGQAAQ